MDHGAKLMDEALSSSIAVTNRQLLPSFNSLSILSRL